MPTLNEDDFASLSRHIEALTKEVSDLRKQVSDAHLADLINKTVDPFFRYQNLKIDGHAAYFSSEDKVFKFSADGVSFSFYLPHGAADQIQKDILRSSYFYQPKPLYFINRERLVGRSSVVADIGANIGNHTVFFGKVMRAKTIHSFEPNPPAFEILSRNVQLNELQGVVELNPVGLGAKASKARNLNNWSGNLGGNQVADDADGDVTIQRFDDLRIAHVDFLKIDVEGRGDGVIAGAMETISRDKPIMLIEETSPGEKQAIHMLKSDLGYREVFRNKLDLILVS